jgi:hypothetical protein
MSPAKGTKAQGDAFHLFLPRSTEFMTFKGDFCDFLYTKTTSSLCLLLQGHPWLYIMGPLS